MKMSSKVAVSRLINFPIPKKIFCPPVPPVYYTPICPVWVKGLVPIGYTQCECCLNSKCSTASLRAEICTSILIVCSSPWHLVWNQFCFFCIEWEMCLFQLFGAYFHLVAMILVVKVSMKRSSFLSYCDVLYIQVKRLLDFVIMNWLAHCRFLIAVISCYCLVLAPVHTSSVRKEMFLRGEVILIKD